MAPQRVRGSHILQEFGEKDMAKAGEDSTRCFSFREGDETATCTTKSRACWRCLLPCLCLNLQLLMSSIMQQFWKGRWHAAAPCLLDAQENKAGFVQMCSLGAVGWDQINADVAHAETVIWMTCAEQKVSKELKWLSSDYLWAKDGGIHQQVSLWHAVPQLLCIFC